MEIDQLDLLARIRRQAAPPILDVRSRGEFAAGHVPGARHMPFWSIVFHAGRVPANRRDPVIVYCGHGPRARLAAAALRLRGFRDVRFLCGHMAQWRRAELPTERG
jgi:rhodanese-related sulfurtransferase